MVIQIVGKQNFHSAKKNQDYYVLHTLFEKQDVSGHAVEGKFVSADIYNKAEIGKLYSIVYDAYANGRAFISDLREVKAASNG